MNTPNLDFTLLSLNQSKKEVTANEALLTIDAIVNTCIIDIDINVPLQSPKNGDMYSIGGSPEKEWVGKENKLAYWYINSWRYIAPKLGLIMWIKNKNKIYVYNGKIWSPNI